MRKLNIILQSLYFLSLIFVFSCRESIIDNSNDFELTAIPDGLNIFRAHDGVIGLEWNYFLEQNRKGFNIYRSENDTLNFQKIDFTTEPFYYDDSLEYDTTYFYKLTSVNKQNVESNFSNYVSAKPVNLYPPLTPHLLNIFAQNWETGRKIILTWANNYDSDIDHYEIYRTDIQGSVNQSNLIGTSRTTIFEDTLNLKLLTRYYYQIKAVDKGNLKSGFSRSVTDILLDAPEPLFPINESIDSSMFNFKFITSGAPATYKIFIQNNQYVDIVDQVTVSSTAIHDTLTVPFGTTYLIPNKKYYWRIAAYSSTLNYANVFSGFNSFQYSPGLK